MNALRRVSGVLQVLEKGFWNLISSLRKRSPARIHARSKVLGFGRFRLKVILQGRDLNIRSKKRQIMALSGGCKELHLDKLGARRWRTPVAAAL